MDSCCGLGIGSTITLQPLLAYFGYLLSPALSRLLAAFEFHIRALAHIAARCRLASGGNMHMLDRVSKSDFSWNDTIIAMILYKSSAPAHTVGHATHSSFVFLCLKNLHSLSQSLRCVSKSQALLLCALVLLMLNHSMVRLCVSLHTQPGKC